MKKIVVHNDRFHADDVFAIATLKIALGDFELIRTRDEDVIKSADIVLDVGGIYDPEMNRYDHHQPEGSGKRENGIPYASFGLIWKHFGKDICESKEAWEFVDRGLVQTVDAGDNGYKMFDLKDEDNHLYQIDSLIKSFNPSWSESADLYDTNFNVAVEIAQKVLEREIKKANDKAKAIPKVLEAYDNAEDKRIVVLDESYNTNEALSDKEEVLYIISPSKLKDAWRVHSIQDGMFNNKKSFPKEWAGLRDKKLQDVTGVSDAKFCHRGLFLAVAKTKDGAVKLAEIAVNS